VQAASNRRAGRNYLTSRIRLGGVQLIEACYQLLDLRKRLSQAEQASDASGGHHRRRRCRFRESALGTMDPRSDKDELVGIAGPDSGRDHRVMAQVPSARSANRLGDHHVQVMQKLDEVASADHAEWA
jgi:hypothetical protein